MTMGNISIAPISIYSVPLNYNGGNIFRTSRISIYSIECFISIFYI